VGLTELLPLLLLSVLLPLGKGDCNNKEGMVLSYN
jgi:hypothetical protein